MKKKKSSKTTTSKLRHDRSYFIASDVTVLNLSYEADEHGQVFPPEMHVEFSNPVPVIYEFDWEVVVGEAQLMRVGNKIVAELKLISDEKNFVNSLQLAMQMTPSTGLQILACNVDDGKVMTVLEAAIGCVSIGNNPNIDQSITPLGSKVQAAYNKRGMN